MDPSRIVQELTELTASNRKGVEALFEAEQALAQAEADLDSLEAKAFRKLIPFALRPCAVLPDSMAARDLIPAPPFLFPSGGAGCYVPLINQFPDPVDSHGFCSTS